MMNKIRFLWVLGILCLPIANYAQIQVERAKHCNEHRQQCCFKIGFPGPQGPPGIPGLPGIPGAIRSLAYGDFYVALNPPDSSPIASNESILLQPVDFSRSPQTRIATGVNLDPTTGLITVAVSGVYEINYTVNVLVTTTGLVNELSVAIQLNSTTIVPGSMRSIQSSAGLPYIQIHGQVKQFLAAGDSITLINAGTQNIQLTIPTGNTRVDPEYASLQIQNIQPS